MKPPTSDCTRTARRRARGFAQRKKAGPGLVVASMSGGNIDLKKFSELVGSASG